jgi:hypothetical protein
VKLRKIKDIFSRQKYLTQVYDLSKKHPLDLIYSNFKGSAALIPMTRCRSHMLGYTADGNPFVDTLLQLSQTQPSYDTSLLKRYYQEYQPLSMQSVLGSDNDALAKYHPMATILPWGTSTPVTKLPRVCVDINAPQLLSSEAFKLGLAKKDNYGWQFFGPVSDGLGVQEYERLISVYNSIKKDGYRPNQHGYIHGQFLVTEQDWAWVNIGGKHRFASLATLGFENIPVALNSRSSALFIHRSDVEFWPNVKNGLFSQQDALNIFDKILKGTTYTALTSSVATI